MHPYPFGVYTLSDEAIQYGHARNEQALALGMDAQARDDLKPYGLKEPVEFGADELY